MSSPLATTRLSVGNGRTRGRMDSGASRRTFDSGSAGRLRVNTGRHRAYWL